jgi:subtilisin
VIPFLLAAITPPAAAKAGMALPAKATTFAALEQATQASGALPVIVMLEARFQPEGSLDSAAAVGVQRTDIQAAQSTLLASLSGYLPGSVKRFATIPFLALSVTPGGLAELEADPAVLNIEPDVADPPALAESTPLIGAPAMWNAGFTGKGQVVAVLDTGVDKNHPFLAGKVVEEACYSTTNPSVYSQSICPGGASSSTATGSAQPYATGVCPPGECDHGTHVAGIAAGHAYDNELGKVAFNGVAKDAKIIAIQVFSVFPATFCTSGTTCVLSYTSDQILGMERVLELHATYNIAAVNFSLGGEEYDDPAECDLENAPRKAMIDNLRSAGIATVAASGNGYSADSLSAPACISSAISVGSTDDGSSGTTVDALSPYSDVAPTLTLLAPGNAITSSIPGGRYAAWAGTSMATPHVTGAWAVLKQKNPSATVDQIAALLVASGLPVTDSRSWSKAHITKPRLNLAFAVSGRVTTGSGTSAAGLAGVTLSADALHSAVTDGSGDYTIADLPLGSYTITPDLAAHGFTPLNREISGGPDQTNVDFTAVQTQFTISGKVTLGSAPGAPGLAGVTVSAGAGHSSLTGVNGDYLLENLSAGDYVVIPSLPQFLFSPVRKSVAVGGSKAGVNFAAAHDLYEVRLPQVFSKLYNYIQFLPWMMSN